MSVSPFKASTKQGVTLSGRLNVLGDKDRKVLRNRFVSQFPRHGIDSFNELFPPSAPLICFSLKGQPCEIYLSDNVPLVFTLAKKKNALLIPSLQLLWKIPDLLPSIIVQAQTPQFLIRGADLMLPGCIQPEGGYGAAGMDIDQVWSVKIAANPRPFAVGQVLLTNDVIRLSEKGKLLQVHHVLGDMLFKMKVPDPLPPGFPSDTSCIPVDQDSERTDQIAQDSECQDTNNVQCPGTDPCAETAEANTQARSKKGDEATDTKTDDESEEEISQVTSADAAILQRDPRKMVDDDDDDETEDAEEGGKHLLDAAIEYCVLDFVKKRVSDSQLPMDASAVWSIVAKLLQVACTDNRCTASLSLWVQSRTRQSTAVDVSTFLPPDIKKTVWKSVKKFASHFKKTKIWTVKEVRGVVTIVKVNRSHPLVVGHVPMAEEALSGIVSTVPSSCPKNAGSKSSAVKTTNEAESQSHQLKAVVAYQVTGHTRDLLAPVGCGEKRLLDVPAVKNYLGIVFDALRASLNSGEYPEMAAGDVSTYAPKYYDGPWDELLSLEPRLVNVILTKQERQNLKNGQRTHLSNDKMVDRFISMGMKPVTLLLPGRQDVKEALTNPEKFTSIEAEAKITVSIQKARRFIRTRVSGIHNFSFIDPKQLAEKLQKACAAAATTCELEDIKGKVKPIGVVVQGAVVNEVCSVLESTYGLPPSMIVKQAA